MTEIRVAAITDASLIAEMSRETFYETFASHNTQADMDKFLSEQFSKEMLMAQVGMKDHVFYIAYADEQPAGYLFLKNGADAGTESRYPIEISRLYARNSFIGKGIGKSLMETALHYALQNGNDCIWLGVWEHNHRAIRFYTSFGFEKFGEHDFILGNDLQQDWLMKRPV